MPAWKMLDLQCSECGHVEERLVQGSAPELCTLVNVGDRGDVCEGLMMPLISAPRPVTIVKGNHDYATRERERLEKRSTDHWKSQGRDEAIDRIRMKRKIDGV